MYDIDHAVKSLILRHRLQIREYKKEMGTIKIKVKADKQEESIFLSQKKLKSFFQALELISSFDEQRKQFILIKIMQYVDSHIDPEIVYDTLLVDIYGKDFEKTCD